MKPIMKAYNATVKSRGNTDGCDYTLLPLTANVDSYLAPVVESHIAKYHSERQVPSQTPQTYAEIMRELGQETSGRV